MPELRAELLSDAAVGGVPVSGYVRSSMRHVPGSVLRGAIASRYLAAGGVIDATFLDAFERGVRWGPLYLGGEAPQPLSWWLHKYRPEATCPKFFDDANTAVPDTHRCPVCGGPLQPGKATITRVPTSLDTHVKLVDGTASEGDLFARERIAHRAGAGVNAVAAGRVDPLTNDGATAIDLVLDALGITGGSGATVWFGGRKSTDGGRARIVTGDAEPAPLATDGTTLTIRLTSPGIFVDDFGWAAGQPRTDELEDILGVPVTVTRTWRRWTTEGGWHAATKLPKPTERAVAAGSVFHLTLGGQPSRTALDLLLRRGLGLRRVEGFGEVAAMPQPPRDMQQLRNRMAILAGLPTKLKATLLDEIASAAGNARAGQPPVWILATRIAGQPPAFSKSFPDLAPRWAEACTELATLTDADELATILDSLRGNR